MTPQEARAALSLSDCAPDAIGGSTHSHRVFYFDRQRGGFICLSFKDTGDILEGRSDDRLVGWKL
jgi:hypothetical protein